MMGVLVFLVLLFGLLGVITAQYIAQYREAYYIWIKEIVYNKEKKRHNDVKIELCSKLESYSREICELSDMIYLIFSLISITFIIIIVLIEINKPLLELDVNINIANATELLAFMLYSSLYILMRFLKIGFFQNTSKTSAIDEKIFELWFKLNCHDCKKKKYKINTEPQRLYEIVAEKLDDGGIKASDDLIKLVEKLRKKNRMNLA